MNKNTFRNLSYGVYIISALDGKRPTGCVANSVMQVTSSPATVAVSVNHDNYTNSCIKEMGKFAVSILTEETDATLIGTFGFQSGKEVNKFDGVASLEREGISLVADANAYLVCKVIDMLETSTHTVFLGEVIDADILSDKESMTYAYYHKVVKGKSPKNAPTYIEEERVPERKWTCGICGYIYEGETPFEELPEDYKCPICKQPKSVFKLV